MLPQGRQSAALGSDNNGDAGNLSAPSFPSHRPRLPPLSTGFGTRQEKLEAMNDGYPLYDNSARSSYSDRPAVSTFSQHPLSGNPQDIPPPSFRAPPSPPPTQSAPPHLTVTTHQWHGPSPHTYTPIKSPSPHTVAPSHVSTPTDLHHLGMTRRREWHSSDPSPTTTQHTPSSTSSHPPVLGMTMRPASADPARQPNALTALSTSEFDSELEVVDPPKSHKRPQLQQSRAQEQLERCVKKTKSATPAKTTRRGRQPGATNWRIEEDERAVDIWYDQLPSSRTEVDTCADIYNVWARLNEYPERDGDKLKKRVDRITKMKKPTGNPRILRYVEKAKEIEARIRKRTKTIHLDDDRGGGSETESTQYDESDLSAVEEVSKEQGKTKGKEKATTESANWSKAPKPRRGNTAAETKAQLAAFLDPEARAERSAAQLEQRTSSAITLSTIANLQSTVQARDAKIDALELQLRQSEKEKNEAQRAADRAESKLAMQEMLMNFHLGQGGRSSYMPTPSSSFASSLDMKDVASVSTPSPFSKQASHRAPLPLQTPGAGPSHVANPQSFSHEPTDDQEAQEYHLTVVSSPKKHRK